MNSVVAVYTANRGYTDWTLTAGSCHLNNFNGILFSCVIHFRNISVYPKTAAGIVVHDVRERRERERKRSKGEKREEEWKEKRRRERWRKKFKEGEESGKVEIKRSKREKKGEGERREGRGKK